MDNRKSVLKDSIPGCQGRTSHAPGEDQGDPDHVWRAQDYFLSYREQLLSHL